MEKKLTVNLLPGFWKDWESVNTRQAIFHQWEQLQASGCIQNFRLAAGEGQGFRTGWFFADSDAYKWLEAAARVWALTRQADLQHLMDDFISLLGRAQQPDGYLFTYNQLHFPGVRWRNLQIEHELYCHGHLVEAGVSHFLSTGQGNLLQVARRAADRVVADFQDKTPEFTPGHQEIELALLRLHEITPGDSNYIDMARQFIERRGRIRRFTRHMRQQIVDSRQRNKAVRSLKLAYESTHPNEKSYQLPPGNRAKHSFLTPVQWMLSALRGEYNQQHLPVEQQVVPVGHAVRFAYLETAVAMHARLSGDHRHLPALEKSWQHMLQHRMYLTGGIGSQPGLEGFGRDDALDPEYAYAETCAALGSLFWNWEMTQLTGKAFYSDLFEWQLYNAALVGLGQDGCSYLYNNPLASRGGITRREWYSVPCCPSNLSRTLADLGKYIYSSQPGVLTVHQYISSAWNASGCPRNSRLSGFAGSHELRTPLAGQGPSGNIQPPSQRKQDVLFYPSIASTCLGAGYDGHCQWSTRRLPVTSAWKVSARLPPRGLIPPGLLLCPIQRSWAEGDVVEVAFDMPIQVRRAPRRVRSCRGKVALARGPLVYCLESVDNPGVNIFSERLDESSLQEIYKPDLLGGIQVITAKSQSGTPMTFIPYHLWGNRGESQMTVWVKG